MRPKTVAIKVILLGGALASLVVPSCRTQVESPGDGFIELRDDENRFQINPSTLQIKGWVEPLKDYVALTRLLGTAVGAADLRTERGSASWRIPAGGLALDAVVENGRLHLQVRSDIAQEVAFSINSDSPQSKSLVIPDGEGLVLPLTNPFWLNEYGEEKCYQAHSGFSFPGWGILAEDYAVSFFVADGLYSQVCVGGDKEKLSTKLITEFREQDDLPPLNFFLSITEPDPLAPAKAYKSWLVESGRFVSFAEKVKRNPAVSKLFGATHAYLWGDGRSKAFLDKLKELEISSMVLTYDQNPKEDRVSVDQEFVEQAKAQGYLVGPYDTYANAQNPKTSDNPGSDWGTQLYPDGCIHKKDGSVMSGFGGRGCELSSEALKHAADPPNVPSRVAGHLAQGINQYFLDVDAYASLHDDFHPRHPMNRARDRQNRLDRMAYISSGKNLVLGSETNVAWSHGVTHYSHGSHGVYFSAFWPILRDKKRIGRWWPPERPGAFFKKMEYSAKEMTAMYDPRFRLPLFQGVFHNSLVSTERWGLSLVKIKNAVKVRSLFSILYNVPTIWNFDLKELDEFGVFFQRHHKIFSKVHSRTGKLPLTEFKWLTPDRLVQQTRFGEEVLITVNFSPAQFGDFEPGCVQIKWLKDNHQEKYCPNP